MNEFAREAAETIMSGIGRRDFVRAVTAVGAGAGVMGLATACGSGDGNPVASTQTSSAAEGFTVLQPGQGTSPVTTTCSPCRIRCCGVMSRVSMRRRWFRCARGRPSPSMPSPTRASSKIRPRPCRVLRLARRGGKRCAAGRRRHRRRLHPAGFRQGRSARGDRSGVRRRCGPGDVLKIETLQATPRVPYGVVSSRHGKGRCRAPRTADRPPASPQKR